MEKSTELLRRAHLVLAFLLHFYVQSAPPDEPSIIPAPISLPLLRVSKELEIPPLLTYSDTVLYNWNFRINLDKENDIPTIDNIRSWTTFTNTTDEEAFYLCSACIELRGAGILELIRLTLDEMFVGNGLAMRRITEYLDTMTGVINNMKSILLEVKKSCDPEVYYNQVRPWLRGEDAVEHESQKRKWIFEGIEDHPDLTVPSELSGPSAGQSSIIHVLDIFLGVCHETSAIDAPSFMTRMKIYMPRNHRVFLVRLKANPRPLRDFVKNTDDTTLLDAYNKTVIALKEFRDAHMIIAALFILGPARRAAKLAAEHPKRNKVLATTLSKSESQGKVPTKGTGGTDLVKFLKATRTRTLETIIPHNL